MRRRVVGAAAALVAAVCALPLATLLVRACAGAWPAPSLWPASFEFGRFGRVLGGEDGLAGTLALSLALSLAVATLSTGLGLVTSKAVAYHPRRQLWLVLAYVPFVISPVILGVCLLYFAIKLSLAGTVLGVILAQTTLAYGFSIVFLTPLWNAEKRGLEQVARSLGASRPALWWRVLLPAARPMLRVCFFQTFLISWVQYGLTLMIGSGKVRTLPLRVFDYVFEADPAYAALAGVLLVLPPLVLLWIERRVLYKAV